MCVYVPMGVHMCRCVCMHVAIWNHSQVSFCRIQSPCFWGKSISLPWALALGIYLTSPPCAGTLSTSHYAQCFYVGCGDQVHVRLLLSTLIKDWALVLGQAFFLSFFFHPVLFLNSASKLALWMASLILGKHNLGMVNWNTSWRARALTCLPNVAPMIKFSFPDECVC